MYPETVSSDILYLQSNLFTVGGSSLSFHHMSGCDAGGVLITRPSCHPSSIHFLIPFPYLIALSQVSVHATPTHILILTSPFAMQICLPSKHAGQ